MGPGGVQLACMFAFDRLTRRAVLRLEFLVLLSLPTFAAAQVAYSGPPILFDQDWSEKILNEHHIPTTKHALTLALKDADFAVRNSAAELLSRRWPNEAKAILEAAMLQEGNARTRIDMALDLAKIGDRAGYEGLITECHDASDWGSDRILAAEGLTDLHDDSCTDSVLEILGSPSDPQDTCAKMAALNLVPRIIHHSGDQEYRSILDLTINALNDPDEGVRLTASITLGRLADASAIVALEKAMSAEQEATLQDAMRRELQRLKDLKQQK